MKSPDCNQSAPPTSEQGFDDKDYYLKMPQEVRQKLSSMLPTGYVRSALSDSYLLEIEARIQREKSETLEWGYWPPLFLFVYRSPVTAIQSLENDLSLVIKRSSRSPDELTDFLKAQPQDDRKWIAGLFEVFVKSTLLKKKGDGVILDRLLPSGRDSDVQIGMGSRQFRLECTVLTDSDEDRLVWDKYMEAKKQDDNATLVRPGRFDPPNAKGPSLDYDCLRFYAKVYDKLAERLDPTKSQLDENVPNVLLISVGTRLSLGSTNPGIGWALDELFADQPKPRTSDRLSLSNWLDFYANELSSKGLLDLSNYQQLFHEIVSAPRKLGGVLLFDRCSLKCSRVNYNANPSCKLSHPEIAQLEELLVWPPDYV